MPALLSDTALGYAMITGTVLLVVVIYTIFKLQKQVRKAKEREEKKKAGKP